MNADERAEPRALWSDDGEPLNVEAAIADALAWMEEYRKCHFRDGRVPRAISALAAYGDAETRDAHLPTPEKEPSDG